MTTHTPGPWTEQVNATGNKAARHDVLAGRQGIANVCGGLSDEAEANARLIAAAPEMLAALKAFVKAYDHIGHGCWPADPHNPYNVLDPARALLARIEGGK